MHASGAKMWLYAPTKGTQKRAMQQVRESRSKSLELAMAIANAGISSFRKPNHLLIQWQINQICDGVILEALA